MALPVKFEEKVKMPPQVGQSGYPYSLSARDLDRNFKYLDDKKPTGGTGSIIFLDCDSNVILKLEWENGSIITSGDHFIQGGCQDGSSS